MKGIPDVENHIVIIISVIVVIMTLKYKPGPIKTKYALFLSKQKLVRTDRNLQYRYFLQIDLFYFGFSSAARH